MVDNQRFLALDVFRGMTVCFMIIVNSPGDWSIAYAPLLHATWHGFTPTDLVFPSFLFAVGNAMAFVMHKYEGQGSMVFWKKTLKRMSIIFLLGFLMYWFPFIDFETMTLKPLAETRILGVLQRIALCYFMASVVIHFFSTKGAIIFSALALLVYWWVLVMFGDPNDPFSMVGYAGNKIDLMILGEKHLYHGEGMAFDPEGILSTLPAVVNVLLGFLVGNFIRKKGNSYEVVAKLMIVGACLLLVALSWNMAFPINKKIWTSSFVLYTVGLDLLILPILIFIVEVKRKTIWTSFFVVFGRNPLFIYLLSEILLITLYLVPVGDSSLQRWFYKDLFGSFASPINASLLFALALTLTCWAVGYALDRRKIYIKV